MAAVRADDDRAPFSPTSDAVPLGYFRLRGELHMRRHGIIDPAHFTCVLGHRLEVPRHIREDGCAECKVKVRGRTVFDCGALVLLVRAYEGGRRQRLYGIDVSPEEMAHFTEHAVSVDEIVRALGYGFPRVKPRDSRA